MRQEGRQKRWRRRAWLGSTGIVGLAPAVGSAIFDATGIRLRSLPLVPKGLRAETAGPWQGKTLQAG